MSDRPDRFTVIRTDFLRTIVWNIPGQIQDAMLQLEDAARAILPLAFFGGDMVKLSNNSSNMSINLEISGEGLCGPAGCFLWLQTEPEYLRKVFPGLDLAEPVHLMPPDFTLSELADRIDAHVPACPPQGPGNHGVCGGTLFFQARISKRGFSMIVADGVSEAHSKFGSRSIYLKDVDISRLMKLLRGEPRDI